jgi:hypothetical protein
MKNFKYYPNYPIILGLSGKAATGKTSVAESIVPKARIDQNFDGIFWDHIYFALPLYELVGIKKNIRGFQSEKRSLFSIHEVLYDIYGGNALGNIPDYDTFFSLVKEIYNMDLGNEKKPRTFLQKVGDLCRSHDPQCFAAHGVNKANYLYRDFVRNFDSETDVPPFCVIVSDVRFENEAQEILKNPNGIIVVFEADDSVRQERIYERDGVFLTKEQMNHSSENEIDSIKLLAHHVINTNNIDVSEQTSKVLEITNSMVRAYA